ncbi:hypothetical protein CPB85DRAFT_1278512 [Mucidula mucida]|nr:hypothetical protein CPB85DRAFT_1278512 [Mucidula mucida]
MQLQAPTLYIVASFFILYPFHTRHSGTDKLFHYSDNSLSPPNIATRALAEHSRSPLCCSDIMDHLSLASSGSSSMRDHDNAPSSATIDDARATESGKASKLGMSSRNAGRSSSGNASSISSSSKFLGVVVPRLSTPHSASSRNSIHLGREGGIHVINASSGPTAHKTRDWSTASFAGDALPLADCISSALGARLPAEEVNGEEEILELISPEVARECHTDVTAASSEPAESDDEMLTFAYPHSVHLPSQAAVHETGRLDEREAPTHAQNGMAFTGSIVDALANAFAANEDESISSPSYSTYRVRPGRSSLFLEGTSGSDSDTPEPPSSPSRPIPEREPRASLRVAQLPRYHAAHTVELKTATDDLDEYLDTEYATHAYQKDWATPPLQAYELPPVSGEAPAPVVLRRPQYTSVTEHFLQRAEEWFGPEALQQADQAVLDGPAKNLKKGTASTKSSAPNSSGTTAVNPLKRKRVPSLTESNPQKGPRVLEEPNGVPSRSSQESARRTLSVAEPALSASDIALLRRFVVDKKIPTDEEVNALNHLVSSLKMEGEHNVFEGKTTANGHFHILVPKKLVAIASRSSIA